MCCKCPVEEIDQHLPLALSIGRTRSLSRSSASTLSVSVASVAVRCMNAAFIRSASEGSCNVAACKGIFWVMFPGGMSKQTSCAVEAGRSVCGVCATNLPQGLQQVLHLLLTGSKAIWVLQCRRCLLQLLRIRVFCKQLCPRHIYSCTCCNHGGLPDQPDHRSQDQKHPQKIY